MPQGTEKWFISYMMIHDQKKKQKKHNEWKFLE